QARVGGVEGQRVFAGGAGGAGDAVDRQVERAPRAAPPLAQVWQPLGAVAFLGVLVLVPDGEVGDGFVAGAFDPDRDVRAMVFGDLQLRDLDVDVELGRVCRQGEQAAKGDGELDAHGNLVGAMWDSVDEEQGEQY